MKIIIAGDGKMGSMLARQLTEENHEIILIDKNYKVLEASQERYDLMVVQGNCATMDVLNQAGVKDADLLIAVTGEDEINLLCCMTAHGMNEKLRTIARIRNPEYSDQIYKMRGMFALSMTINPEKQAAVEIERLLKYPGFLKRDTFAKGRVEIVELRVDKDSKLCNAALIDMYSIVKCKVLVCTVLRDGKAVAPDGKFVLREGDRIFVTAPSENLSLLLHNLGIITHKVKRVMLCGGGKVSYYLAKQLEKSGMDVQIIERDPEKCVELADALPKADIIQGDISNEFFLESEGIGRCDALVTLTGLDELNMITSLFGGSCGVQQIITKLSRANNRIYDNLNLGSVINPKELCCNTITRFVRAMQNQTGAAKTVHFIADGQAEAMDFLVDEATMHCGEPLKQLRIKKNVLIVCITKSGEQIIPNGDSCFEKGDNVIVVTSGDKVIYQLNDIFEN